MLVTPGKSARARRGVLKPDYEKTWRTWTRREGTGWDPDTAQVLKMALRGLAHGCVANPPGNRPHGLRMATENPRCAAWQGFASAGACVSWQRGWGRLRRGWRRGLQPAAERVAQRFRRGFLLWGAAHTHGSERFGPRAWKAPQRFRDTKNPMSCEGAEVSALEERPL